LHPDGNQLAVLLWSGKAFDLWDLARRTKVTHSLDVLHDNQGAKRLSFSPDGSALAITSAPRGLGYVWDTTQWRVVSSLNGHTDTITDVSYSTDGTRVATSSLDGTVRLWDTKSGALLWTFIDKEGGPVWSVTFSSNDLQLMAGTHDLLLWDTRPKP
jgi:WD40 repeat protein